MGGSIKQMGGTCWPEPERENIEYALSKYSCLWIRIYDTKIWVLYVKSGNRTE